MNTISIKDAYDQWEYEIKPMVIEHHGPDDRPALAEEWSNFTDSLCKEGALTALQYNYCPAHDDPMPECDLRYLLEQLGFKLLHTSVPGRPDGIDMGKGAKHYHCTLKRGNKSVGFYYSMGSAHTSPPDLVDVVDSLIMDSEALDHDSFESWADEMGFDNDSLRGFRAWELCRKQSTVFVDMFSKSELDDLRELFSEY